MASTYSNLKIQLMATGENSGTWGNVTNVNLGTALEEAIAGSADVTFSSGNVTLTLTDTNASQTARNMRLNLTGTTGGARDLIVPAIEKMYLVNNGCADAVTVKVSGQTGIAVPAGKTMLVYNNGTDVVDGVTHLTSLTLGSALPIASGGTGSTSTTYANLQSNVSGVLPIANGGTGSANAAFSGANITSLNASNISAGTLAVAQGGTGATTHTSGSVLIGAGTGAITSVAYGTSGNVLTSNGSAWVSQAISAGGDYIMNAYTSPATWTKPAGLKAVKVTVVGGGGGGGNKAPDDFFGVGGGGGGGGTAFKYLDAPAIPGPISVTIGTGGGGGASGNTSSFGPLVSASGGSAGANANLPTPTAAGGAGGGTTSATIGIPGRPGYNSTGVAIGGPSLFGYGGQSLQAGGAPAYGYGGGGGGAYYSGPGAGNGPTAGTGGLIIVEEFY